jgi:hypothetical protein
MRFGGHETFAVREGWLHKGLMLLSEHPERMDEVYVADWLGVGRNMAKSIKHWLLATNLAERPLLPNSRKRGPMELTHLGRLVLDRDPYFLERGTWLAIHVNLVNNTEHAATWNWFFNHFLHSRFERSTCNEALRRYIAARESRQPSPKTLQRDLACLLASYAKDVPPTVTDPEDATESPFRDLGLLVHFKDSGSFGRVALSPLDVPPELLPYALVKAHDGLEDSDSTVEISVRDASLLPSGPGRCFNLDLEAFHELCSIAQNELGGSQLEVYSLAGERFVRIKKGKAEHWLSTYFDRLDRKAAA